MGKLKGAYSWLVKYLAINKSLLFLCLVSFLLSFSPLKIFSFFILLLITARLLRNYFGFITAIVISYLIFYMLVSMVSLAVWSYKGTLAIPLLIGLWLLFLLICLGLKKSRVSLLPKREEILITKDIIALILSIFVGILISLPVLKSPSVITATQAIAGGGDNTAHMEIVKSIDLNKNVVYGQSNHYNTSLNGSDYPQSWHVNVAILKWFVDPLVKSKNYLTIFIAIYFLSTVLWFCLLTYLLCIAILYGVGQLKHKATPFFVIAPIGIAVLGWLISMQSYGHESQIAATVFYILLILAGSLACTSKNKVRAKNSHNLPIYLLILASAGAIMSYYFIAPIVIPTFVVLYLIAKRYTKTRPTITEGLTVLALSFFCLYELVFRYLYNFIHTQAGQSVYDVSGLVAKSNLSTLFILFIIAFIGVIYFRKNRYLLATMSVATVAFIFSAGLRLMYVINHMQPNYYFYKSNICTMVSLGVVYGILILLTADRVTASNHRLESSVVFSILFIAGIQLAFIVHSPLVNGYLNSTNFGTDDRQTQKLFEIMAKNPNEGKRLIFLGSCNRANDIRATQLARSLTPRTDNKYISLTPTALGIQDEGKLFSDFNEYYQTTKNSLVFVANDRKIGLDLQTYLNMHQIKYELINMDPDLYQEKVSQCPERVYPTEILSRMQ